MENMSIANDIKEIFETLEGKSVKSINEFRQEWISSLNVDERFSGVNIAVVNHVCNIAIERTTA